MTDTKMMNDTSKKQENSSTSSNKQGGMNHAHDKDTNTSKTRQDAESSKQMADKK